jgi:outer membrane lipoprotein carrier protein
MKLLSLSCTLVAALAAAHPAFAQSPGATLDRATAAWEKVRTARATFEQTVTNSLTGSTASARGEFQQQRPGMLAIRFVEPNGDRIVSDGKAVWIYLPSSAPGQVVKRSARDAGAMPIDVTRQFLDDPHAKYDVSSAGAATIAGRATTALLLVPKAGTDAPFSRATVWIDDQDALIRQFEVVEPNGITRRVRITSLQLNVPVDRAAFRFEPPRGVKVVER